MFHVDDMVVYPGHGVARITRIVSQSIGKTTVQFFELSFLNKDLTILVPMEKAHAIGLRPLSSPEHIEHAFRALAKPLRPISHYELTASNWNKRSKAYAQSRDSGDLTRLLEMYRELLHIAQKKELSFGEKSLLQQTEMLLAQEISIVKKAQEEKTIEQLRILIQQANQTTTRT